MEFSIRPFKKQDIPEIMAMIRELAIFEKAEDKVKNSITQMENEMDYFSCVIAETKEGEILGMALYFYAYYTWVGKSMYLDDLVVKEGYRGNGIGSALLNAVIAEARGNKCKRIRWQVLDWNEKAIELYKTYGCDLDGEWLNCDIDLIK